MRIAISGTHCAGKTTLIEEFLRRYPEFAHEPEPYTALVEDYGEEFSSEPNSDDFYRQLEFNVERLRQNKQVESVIYERCPIDFLSYVLALGDLKLESRRYLCREDNRNSHGGHSTPRSDHLPATR